MGEGESKYIKQRRTVGAMPQSAQGNTLGNILLRYCALKEQKHWYTLDTAPISSAPPRVVPNGNAQPHQTNRQV